MIAFEKDWSGPPKGRPRGFKKDLAAQAAWGEAYDAIPKSVFALAAWHLANLASGEADAHGAAARRFCDELCALMGSGILDAAQGKRAVAAVERAA